ncbi:ATP-binding protein [Bacterioplanes sanyensis]|nr:ATP-binding protein [Bacterioplanes sanyensis]
MYQPGVLSRKLLLAILLCSSVVTVLMTGFILWRDYQIEVSASQQAVERIRLTYVESLSISLWQMDERQLESQLQGIVNLPHIVEARVEDALGTVIEVGSLHHDEHRHVYEIDLFVQRHGDEPLGSLRLCIDRDYILAQVYDKAITILLSQFIRTMLVSALILMLVTHMVTRHLNKLAAWADQNDLHRPLVLQRQQRWPDELSRLQQAMDHQRRRILQALQQRDQANDQLRELNDTLEHKVEERTQRLTEAFQHLQRSMHELRSTQEQLVMSEKMAQLGNLVAGVAHELNTPLGTAMTASSFLHDTLHNSLHDTELDDDVAEALQLMEDNLRRALNIVNTFKRLAVDPEQEARRRFRLDELEAELAELIAQYGVADRLQLHLQLADVWMNTYFSSFMTVLQALLSNSIEHGYPDGQAMTIGIEAQCVDRHWLQLVFSDDGVGMTTEALQRAFDPFYTTRRFKGNTGLGLHLVYNLVTQILAGSIEPQQSERGVSWILRIPVDVTREERTPLKGLFSQHEP